VLTVKNYNAEIFENILLEAEVLVRSLRIFISAKTLPLRGISALGLSNVL
jgi:hypothetical protein